MGSESESNVTPERGVFPPVTAMVRIETMEAGAALAHAEASSAIHRRATEILHRFTARPPSGTELPMISIVEGTG
jgi:hypothetical protein